jgi:RNA polymerase sigma-70 factor (ECF subfamily)
MGERDWLAEAFEQQRPHLRAVAVRMLGASSEAEDAVQEAWLRLQGSDTDAVRNLRGWLTTVVGRICLDRLRTRAARREQPLTPALLGEADLTVGADPAGEAEVADSVGMALLVVLDTLEPVERLAFVLHDVFAVPYAEIAPVVERSVDATKMMASRARRKLQHTGPAAGADLARRRAVVDAFLAASRRGNFEALLELLDPAATFRADAAARAAGAPDDLVGAEPVARQFCGRARAARLALIDGAPGAVWAPGGRAGGAFVFALDGERVTGIELVCDPEQLQRLEITFVGGSR